MRLALIFFLGIHFSGCSQPTSEQSASLPLAFPGAEGFGKHTTGGRGGEVYIVTNLSDSGPGSLREGIRKKGPRTITFAISGTIELKSELAINNGDLTIAGQTAPGDGICLKNYQTRISANNVIVRYLRFRLGDEASQQADAFDGTKNKNIIIDHCSISWSTDECASFYRNENFTMQWCIISESLNSSVHEKGDHGYGAIWGGSGATFHHNLMAHHNSRLPRFSGSATTPNPENELVDFRNNVIYNWFHNNTYGGEMGRYNMVNNYYKPGPSTPKSKRSRIVNPSEPYGQFYISGNYLDGSTEITKDNPKGVVAEKPESLLAGTAFSVGEISTQTSEEAYNSVLLHAGASLKRDAIDTRIINEVKTGTAAFGLNGIIDSQKDVGGWPVLETGVVPKDKDGDGIADEWEIANGLDSSDGEDGAGYGLSKSYTNLEVYLDFLIRS